jgi:hypothetical protein
MKSFSAFQSILTCILIQALHVAKSYRAEVTWRDEHYIPADVDEHLQISLGSIAAMQTVVLTFVSLGDVTTREAIDWALTYPKIVRGLTVIARIMNDIMSHEVNNNMHKLS